MSDSKISDGGPAFPVPVAQPYGDGWLAVGGMSLRAYAAIKLRVPESGINWLDEMIRKARRDEFAGQVLAGMCADARTYIDGVPENERNMTVKDYFAKRAYSMADAMPAARQSGGAQ